MAEKKPPTTLGTAAAAGRVASRLQALEGEAFDLNLQRVTLGKEPNDVIPGVVDQATGGPKTYRQRAEEIEAARIRVFNEDPDLRDAVVERANEVRE